MSGVRELSGGCEVVFVHMFLEIRQKDWPRVNSTAGPMSFTLQGASAEMPPSLVPTVWKLCLCSFYFLYKLEGFIFIFLGF